VILFQVKKVLTNISFTACNDFDCYTDPAVVPPLYRKYVQELSPLCVHTLHVRTVNMIATEALFIFIMTGVCSQSHGMVSGICMSIQLKGFV
jgi:hypothetical protein